MRPGDVVVDCGASEGLWALSVIEKVGKIFLIEPQEVFAKSLQKTFAPYILTKKAILLNCAVGACDSMCNLVERFIADIEAKVLVNQDGQTPLRCLDSLFEGQQVDFIKVDIEGYEMDLLLGAGEVIRENSPKLAIAVYHKGNNHLAMVEYVRSIVTTYNWRLTGMTSWGMPLMLHMWVPGK